MTFEQMHILTNRLKDIEACDVDYLQQRRLKTFIHDIKESGLNKDIFGVSLLLAAWEVIQ